MSNTIKLCLAASALALTGFAAGRYSAPVKVRTETKTVEVDRKVETTKTDTDRSKHRETTVTEKVTPDGTKTVVTKTIEDTQTDKKTGTHTQEDAVKSSSTVKEASYASSKVTISVLGGSLVDFTGPFTPVYGASVTRPILGPLTLGIWGLTSKVVGVSIGLTF